MQSAYKKVSQQKIADNLNISRTTVSRCFTNHSGVNPLTRAQVFAEAKRLGYDYFEQRTEKKINQKTIGVIICTDHENLSEDHELSPGFTLMPGISEFALINDITVDIEILSPKLEVDNREFRNLIKEKKKKWKGLLLIYPFKVSLIEELKRNFPCVSLVEQFGYDTIDCVDVDHSRGISLLLDSLIEKHHKRIGFLTRAYTVEACWSHRRFGAFNEKLIREGISLNHSDVINIYPNRLLSPEESIKEAIKQTRDGVTAWVCAADHIAYDLINALENENFNVPRDVSVVGFDGIQAPAFFKQKLFTIKIPHRTIGYYATKRLSEIIKNPFDKSQLIYIKGEILEGNTISYALNC